MPLYLYAGDEDYLLRRAVAALRQKVVDPAMAPLTHKVLSQPAIADVIEGVGAVTLSLGGDSLLEVHDFAWLHKAAEEGAEEKSLEALKAAIADMAPSKHLLFASRKIDRKIRFPKWLAAQAGTNLVECKKLPFWETDRAVDTLMHEARDQGIRLAPQAANLLVATLGTDLQTLVNELGKLWVSVLHRGPEASVTVEDVQRLSNYNENTFRMLTDWMHGTNRDGCFEVLDELLLRQNVIPLFAVTQTYLDGTFRLKLLRELGLSEAQMAERLKKKPFAVRKDLEKFAGVSLGRLYTLKERLLTLEWQAKTGRLDGQLAFELLLGS